MTRTRSDLCPGVGRPWPADDGALVRLRLIGGAVEAGALRELGRVATRFGDGDVHLTRRANLQVRGLPLHDDALPSEVVEALRATGLLPSVSHELVRNVLVSPLSGLVGGRADLRPVAAALDAALCADPALADLSARFLFVLDDGRGDVLDRSADLGLVALDERTAQVFRGERDGVRWGPLVSLETSPERPGPAVEALLDAARAFLAARVHPAHGGQDDDARRPWHLSELARPLDLPTGERDPRVPAPSEPAPHGAFVGASGPQRHVGVPDGRLDAAALEALLAGVPDQARLVVTPWRSLVLPAQSEPAEVPHLTAPTRRYPYEGDGQAIYVESFATIRAEADLSAVPSGAERVVVRMVHGTGQVDLAPDVVVHPALVGAARGALRAGAPIVADAHMVASGVTRSRLPADNEVLCALRDPRVPQLARAWGTTRSAAALSLLADRIGGSVVAIGNAPTALFHLLEMLADGCPPPAAIVGCPVGFVGAAESKQALVEYAEAHGVPYLTVHGRRGGSAMTASALNAIAQERE